MYSENGFKGINLPKGNVADKGDRHIEIKGFFVLSGTLEDLDFNQRTFLLELEKRIRKKTKNFTSHKIRLRSMNLDFK